MEEIRGLSLEELDGQHAELLPDRLEMRRRRKQHAHLICQNATFIVFIGDEQFAPGAGPNGANVCFIQQAQ
jgi:hypothetical protein